MGSKPEFTMQMAMHINFGSDGHGYVYTVFKDGTEIGSRSKRTGKEPLDIITVGENQLDVIGKTGKEIIEWLGEQPK
jgi:hypothetical protein